MDDFTDTEYGDLSHYGRYAEDILTLLPMSDAERDAHVAECFPDGVPEVIAEWVEESRNDTPPLSESDKALIERNKVAASEREPKLRVSHTEAQELHEIIGGILAARDREREGEGSTEDLLDAMADLPRALEIAALVVSDTDPGS